MKDEGAIRSVIAFQNADMLMTNPRLKVTGKQATTQKPLKARSQAVMEPYVEMHH